jgi:hypothetical protein
MQNINSEAQYSNFLNQKDVSVKSNLLDLMKAAPIPENELLYNMPLFIDRRIVSRMLFMNEVYQKILPVHGYIFEFGVRYGQNLALMTSLRGIYEPFNHNRKIVGFDTFEGFVDIDAEKDGNLFKKGDYAVPENYEDFLGHVLQTHEQMSPIENLKKHELIKGDVSKTLPEYLKQHQETIVSLAYFDLDVYQPTRDCLEAIKPHLTKGSVLMFDELNDRHWPGETIALREVFGTNNVRIVHSPFRAMCAYFIYE